MIRLYNILIWVIGGMGIIRMIIDGLIDGSINNVLISLSIAEVCLLILLKLGLEAIDMKYSKSGLNKTPE